MSFEFQDLYAVGLGFDLIGAVLLALGLIANDLAELNRIAGSFYGSNPYQAVGVARDRINALSGVTLLLLGFLVEAGAFLIQLDAHHVLRAGDRELAAAGLLLVAALTLGWLGGRLHLKFRLARTVVTMTRYRLDGSLMDYPAATTLPGRAAALGYERNADENDLDFVRRTLGVTNLIVRVVGDRERLFTDPPLPGE